MQNFQLKSHCSYPTDQHNELSSSMLCYINLVAAAFLKTHIAGRYKNVLEHFNFAN
jgi:hypothetical protein